jgi:hypothetical protein
MYHSKHEIEGGPTASNLQELYDSSAMDSLQTNILPKPEDLANAIIKQTLVEPVVDATTTKEMIMTKRLHQLACMFIEDIV